MSEKKKVEFPAGQVAEFYTNNWIRKLSLFGSALREDFRPDSDIDLLVEFQTDAAPEIQDTGFAVGESGTTYEINLTTSSNPDQTVVISHIPKSFHAQAERAQQVPALDLMRSMMRGLPVAGYEIFKANRKEVYRDAHFSMKGNQLQPFKSFKCSNRFELVERFEFNTPEFVLASLP